MLGVLDSGRVLVPEGKPYNFLLRLMPKQINPFAGKKLLGSNNSKKAPKRGKKAKGKGKPPIMKANHHAQGRGMRACENKSLDGKSLGKNAQY